MAAVPGLRRPDPQRGVFETMLVLDGCPVELEAHLARLRASLSTLYPDSIPPPLDVPVERGPHGLRSTGTSGMDAGEGLTSIATRITVAPEALDALGVRISFRRISRDRHPVSLRSLAVPGGLGAHKWADRSLLDEAQARLPANALPLIVDDDALLEASRANLFAVRDGALFTPPLDGRILPGITRTRVLEIAGAMGIDTSETELSRAHLLAADEVFLTGSVRGIEPVASLDGTELAAPGPLAGELAAALRRAWLGAPVA
jgi:para-aminobenzoate synthetase / 4-amino-4-deoxychorismate lyase